MIRNEREYRITRSQARLLAEALAATHATARPADVPPLLWQAQHDALQSQIRDLEEQLAEYDALRQGTFPSLTTGSLSELPTALVKARIAAGISQRELANRLGIKEQQVQRYEANSYAGASLTRLQQVVDALGVQIEKELFLPVKRLTPAWLRTRLRRLGIDRNLQNRLLSAEDAEILDAPATTTASLQPTIDRITSLMDRVFEVPAATLLAGIAPTVPTLRAAEVRFKAPANATESSLRAYTRYAHYLARLVTLATPSAPPERPPTDARTLRTTLEARYGTVSLDTILSYAWDNHIPVLPLRDPGAFHAACFFVNGRWIIVLKQRTLFDTRWENDIAHELGHIADPTTTTNDDHVDLIENPFLLRSHPREEYASRYAATLFFGGQEELLANECVARAQNRVELLKGVVPAVAAQHHVSVDHLANYLAFRLAPQGIHWWGAATNLQRSRGNPYRLALDHLRRRLDTTKLSTEDRELLTNALSEPTL